MKIKLQELNDSLKKSAADSEQTIKDFTTSLDTLTTEKATL